MKLYTAITMVPPLTPLSLSIEEISFLAGNRDAGRGCSSFTTLSLYEDSSM